MGETESRDDGTLGGQPIEVGTGFRPVSRAYAQAIRPGVPDGRFVGWRQFLRNCPMDVLPFGQPGARKRGLLPVLPSKGAWTPVRLSRRIKQTGYGVGRDRVSEIGARALKTAAFSVPIREPSSPPRAIYPHRRLSVRDFSSPAGNPRRDLSSPAPRLGLTVDATCPHRPTAGRTGDLESREGGIRVRREAISPNMPGTCDLGSPIERPVAWRPSCQLAGPPAACWLVGLPSDGHPEDRLRGKPATWPHRRTAGKGTRPATWAHRHKAAERADVRLSITYPSRFDSHGATICGSNHTQTWNL